MLLVQIGFFCLCGIMQHTFKPQFIQSPFRRTTLSAFDMWPSMIRASLCQTTLKAKSFGLGKFLTQSHRLRDETYHQLANSSAEHACASRACALNNAPHIFVHKHSINTVKVIHRVTAFQLQLSEAWKPFEHWSFVGAQVCSGHMHGS